MSRLFLWLSVSLSFATACAVSPRLPRDVATAVARDDMRLMRTDNVDLYYPAEYREEATELLERAEGCVRELRKHTIGRGGLSATRIEIIFADLPFNNAFVKPPSDGDFFSVIPTHFTMDMVTELGIPPAPSYIACHELTHYVHSQQTFRVIGGLNRALGYFLTPQIGLDAWFLEGLATYYETRLQPGTGRPAWPVWEGLFQAAVSDRTFRGGHLSPYNREIHWGNHYLYGSHFIGYLVEKYGEEKLWKLVLRQGKSFFFPFAVNHRFKKEYGKSLSSLISEYDAYLAATYPARLRQSSQKVVREVGMNARYARASDGSEALIRQAMDAPTTLSVYDPKGTLEAELRLTDVLPPHDLLTPSTAAVSGLSFSRDGRFVYFVLVEDGPVFQRARLMRFARQGRKLARVVDDLAGTGGDVSPDGRSYLFVGVSGHGHTLSSIDLQTFERKVLHRAPKGVYFTAPRFSPDGQRVVVSVFDGAFAIRLFDARTFDPLESYSRDGQSVFDATFVDDQRLLFLAEDQQRFQVFTLDLTSNTLTRLSDAPYLAQQPRAARGTVRFLNREGLRYTLDEIAYVAPPPAALPQAPLIPAEDPVTASGDPVAPPSADVQTIVPTSPAHALRVGEVSDLPAPPRLVLTPKEDEPASTFPRLLIPSIRVPLPFVLAVDQESATPPALGFYLGGTDALGKHRWGLSFGVQPSSSRLSGSVGYINAQLAPLLLELGASQLDFEERITLDDDDRRRLDVDDKFRDERRRQRDAFMTASLVLRTTLLALGAHVTADEQPDDLELPERSRTLGGASLWLDHTALEGTPMSGPTRGFRSGVMGSVYPESLGTLGADLYDLRGSLALYAPLPLSKRHTLRLVTRGRALMGRRDLRLLEVGGLTSGTLFNRPGEDPSVAYPGLPPKRRFSEALRGFETTSFDVNQIGIVELTYRYPLIVDVGTATSLWLFPAFFLRQIDFELFATGAAESQSTIRRDGHAAAGAALSIRFVWLAPLELRYEVARRLSDDRAVQHLVVLDVDMDDS